VIESLEKVHDKRAVNFLIAALNHSNPEVKWHSAYALGTIADTDAEEPLTLLLQDADVYVRQHAQKALSKIQGKDVHVISGNFTTCVTNNNLGCGTNSCISLGETENESEHKKRG